MKNLKQRLEISKWQFEINHQRTIVSILKDRLELMNKGIENSSNKQINIPQNLLHGLQKEEVELQELLCLLNEQINLLKDTLSQPDTAHNQLESRVKKETQAFGEITTEYHMYMNGFFKQITFPHLQKGLLGS
jgi:chromosome segregation ATPase